MTIFQLAKTTRPGQQQANPTVTIPDSARTILESIVNPLVVVSFYSCRRDIQEALWSALYRRFYKDDLDSTGAATTGIWAFVSETKRLATDMDGIPTLISSSAPRYLYLIPLLAHGSEQDLSSQNHGKEHGNISPVDRLILALTALTSARLTVVSDNQKDAQADLATICPALEDVEEVTEVEPSLATYGRPILSWWSRYGAVVETDGETGQESEKESGSAGLEQLLAWRNNDSQRDVETIGRFFEAINYYPPPTQEPLEQLDSQQSENLGIEGLLTNDLQDQKDDTQDGTLKGMQSLASWTEDIVADKDASPLENDQLINGLLLYVNISVGLSQLEKAAGLSPPPSTSDAGRGLHGSSHHRPQVIQQTLISERILLTAGATYHETMNKHLDETPIPVPWHTLAMIHNEAQSTALAMAEVQFLTLPLDVDLKQLLMPKIREMCLVGNRPTSLPVTMASDVKATYSPMEPSGGLYMEYYTANASALKSYHIDLLDELWQSTFSEEALDALDAEEEATGESNPLETSDKDGHMKDYMQFVRLSEQIRQRFLEKCIPSLEATTTFSTLNEMLQDESTGFLELLSSLIVKGSTSVSTSGISPSSSTSSMRPVNPNKGYRLSRLPTKAAEPTDDGEDGAVASLDENLPEVMQRPAISQPPATALERRIAEILQTKSTVSGVKAVSTVRLNASRNKTATAEVPSGAAQATGVAKGSKTGTAFKSIAKESESRVVVQFGWTLHLLHANTQQYAWIWTWLYNHEGSSRQNAVACDSKMYTASKWIILPAKDLIRTRKDWKVSYGDRVWLVSYWFSTRNAKMELPEYLPLARGAPCRHVIPYGETYVICKTCPADVLCMRCFRASDHTDHTMYLQCSWGTSICVCEDRSRLKPHHSLHCSIHCAESHRTYSRLGKGKQCSMTFKPGEMVYSCQTCAVNGSETSVLCARCFRSQNHFGHSTTAQIADDGTICSCQDSKSWSKDIPCSYHSVGQLGPEYLRQPSSPLIPSALKDKSSTLSSPSKTQRPSPSKEKPIKRHSALNTIPGSDQIDRDGSISEPPTPKLDTPVQGDRQQDRPDRCRHIFKPGEDIYHCQDCSVDDRVVICSRCFHGSACMNHRWRMGEFLGSSPKSNSRSSSSSSSSQPSNTSSLRSHGAHSAQVGRGARAPEESEVLSVLVDNLSIQTEPSRNNPVDMQSSQGKPVVSTIQEEDVEESAPEDDEESGVEAVATCDCGDPSLFKTAFDCNYHLPDEYRPMPHLVQCNYLFLRGDSMYQCRTCYGSTEAGTSCSTAWICEHCFDLEKHKDHQIEKTTNIRNEGLYCHCGSPDRRAASTSAFAVPSTSTEKILREKSTSEIPGENKEREDNNTKKDRTTGECMDDHNRQTVICSREIKEGMYYYKCQSCQTDPNRVFCEPCFIKEAHEDHLYQRLCAPSITLAFPELASGFDRQQQQSQHQLPPMLQCGCGENSAFRFATHCQQHERSGGTNVVLECRYRAKAGEWVAHCRTCFPEDMATALQKEEPYLCLRCRQASDHQEHDITWIKITVDRVSTCSCGKSQTIGILEPLETGYGTASSPSPETIAATEDIVDGLDPNLIASLSSPLSSPSLSPSSSSFLSAAFASSRRGPLLDLKPLCSYHTMIYKTTPSTTLYLHSHPYRSINHQDHNEVSGYRYHNQDNDWIVTRPDMAPPNPTQGPPSSASSSMASRSSFLQWKDVFWLKHGQTGQFLNSMASLRINQGFQEISTMEAPHSNNDWIVEETTWLRQQILSDE
ncbi:hypothetical protein EMPS_04850 [Entomortierella parvispora]|uniref:E3 ubiquitin-protein ligase n=1 Tax=Entomortierella parvispora TaxID=205924 RepID=A0A9P3H9D8_9FUNG|nr:hypothetical protein EMPS_04850 [Entomortierella parvispora]